MTRLVALLTVLAALPAHADPLPDGPSPDPVTRARELYQRGDFVHAREQLLLAYRAQPDPELLFALGQVEFNLAHYPEAIAYYERFLATEPAADHAALAQQAIGAARARVVEPPPPPPPIERRTRHRWQLEDTGLTALGAIGLVVGVGLIYDGHAVSQDQTGTLAEYDRRLGYARDLRTAGIAVTAGGALVIAAALVHWRLHTETFEVRPTATATSAGLSLERAW